ncbi:MAG TPA: hypothetical protein PLG99_09270, partial [Kaistiaceae bacterium]|nr:hypothetical protein [Kaistiaceae bacterium]
KGETIYNLTDPQTVGLDLDGSDGSVSIGRAYYAIWDNGGNFDRISYEDANNTILNLNEAPLTTDDDTLRAILEDVVETNAQSILDSEVVERLLNRDIYAAGFLSEILTSGGATTNSAYGITKGSKIEDALSGDGRDVLIGNKHDNRLSAGADDDFLVGGQGKDQLKGGPGSDIIHGGDDIDVARYDLFDLDDPSLFASAGIEIGNFRNTDEFSLAGPGIMLDHVGLGGESNTGTDTLIEIEHMLLTRRGDIVDITPDAPKLSFDLVVDLNDFAPVTVSKDDWDEVDFRFLDTGIVFMNGATMTKAGDSNGPVDMSLAGKFWELGWFLPTLVGVTPEILLASVDEYQHPLTFYGTEKITGTMLDDTIWVGWEGEASPLKWTDQEGQKSTHSTSTPRIGEIDGNKGNDYIVHWGAEYIKAGEVVPEELGGTQWIFDGEVISETKAAQDFQMTLKGGEDSDRVYAVSGTKAVVSGGTGNDILFNQTFKGELWGGDVDGFGDGETDIFWFWPGTFIKDAEEFDLLEMFGIPLSGGTNLPQMGADAFSNMAFLQIIAQNSLAMDWIFPFIFYGRTKGGQLLVYNVLMDTFDLGPDNTDFPQGVMVVEDFDFGGLEDEDWATFARSDLNMTFRTFGPEGDSVEISQWTLAFGYIFDFIDAMFDLAKAIHWQPSDDPLVLDLDGDGIETVGLAQSGTHFDLDGDFFAERAGWLGPDDGFLAVDRNGNGRIDDITEMFGGPDLSAFSDLAAHDDDGDGAITAADAIFADLRVWRDLDQDGVTDEGELETLDFFDIVSIGVGATDLGDREVFGNRFPQEGTFTLGDGTVNRSYGVVFGVDATDTIYRGERGTAEWLKTTAVPDAKGFGAIADLAVDISNDLDLAETVFAAAAAMTTPDLKLIREQATPIYGAWAQSLELTRELTAVLVADGGSGATFVDSAIYIEDAAGGHY